MPTVYVASKAKHAFWWRALRAAGIDITSTWIDWSGNRADHEPCADEWQRHWSRCCKEARNADILLFVDLDDERQCGSLIEMGAALASGAQVYIVSPHWWSISHHPDCRVFPDLEHAVT